MTHACISACVSAAIRIYQYIKVSQTKDITHYNLLGTLCSFLELTFGIWVVCLPTLPKFLGSFEKPTFWSDFKNSLRFLIRSKTEPKISEPRCDGSQAATRHVESNDFTARLKTYNVLPSDIETVSTSTKESGERITEDGHPETQTPTELQIMRTVHIATTHEAATASTMPTPRY